MNIRLELCTKKDLDALIAISYTSYDETFREDNTEENMREYLERAFNRKQIAKELSNEHSSFYFLYVDEKLAAYMKLNQSIAQTEDIDPNALEIERIYVLKAFHGKALGRVLMNKAFDFASQLNKRSIWLGVWENNHKAIRFYEGHGFYKIAQHSFFMGDDEQIDFIFRKDLNEEN
jgi:ribosomal protein S18 acetylase RimI-like enzyme